MPFIGWRLRQKHKRRKPMRKYLLAGLSAAILTVPTAAFPAQIDIGPGGVRVGPGYHRHYYNYGGGECYRLRQACLHKGQLGEEGMGNCHRYRAMCR
jgi:hypothetical protein